MTIFISSDHGGFNLKGQMISFLEENFKEDNVIDLGPSILNPNDDYPTYAFNLAKEVSQNNNSLGILICRSGNGMVIAANKVKGAYAALCFTKHHAEMARKDDGANILCLDADYEKLEDHLEIIRQFIQTSFSGPDTRYGRRLKEIQDFEATSMK